MRRYLGIVFFLIVLLLVSWIAGRIHVSLVAERADVLAATETHRAIERLDQQFAALQMDMLGTARRVAETDDVTRPLAQLADGAISHADEGLLPALQFVGRMRIDRHMGVEVYDSAFRLVAWQGFSMPFESGLRGADVLQRLQTGYVSDVGAREALVLWHPIRRDGETVGAVRVLRTVGISVPIRNQYLQDYDIAADWRPTVGRELTIVFPGDPGRPPPEAPEAAMELRGLDGTLLAYASVEATTAGDVVSAMALRYENLMIFWLLTLAVWLFFGIWLLYRRSLRIRIESARERSAALALLALAAAGGSIWLLRYVLIWMDIPSRWLQPGTLLANLFDPTYLASMIGAGAAQTAGDLLLTAIFGVGFALMLIEWCYRQGLLRKNLLSFGDPEVPPTGFKPSLVRFYATALAAGFVVVTFVMMHSGLVRYAILDSTVDYFARTGLMPHPMVLAVFCALLLFTLYLFLTAIAILWTAGRIMQRYRPPESRLTAPLAVLATVVVPLLVFYLVTPLGEVMPFAGGLAFVVAMFAAAVYGLVEQERWANFLTVRRILLATFIMTMLTYPLLYWGMDSQRAIRMLDAADAFADGRDVRVIFGVEQVLTEAQEDILLHRVLAEAGRRPFSPAFIDSLAADFVAASFLGSLDDYEISFSIYDRWGTRMGSYHEFGHLEAQRFQEQADALFFQLMRDMYHESNDPGVLVESITGRREQVRLQYAGIAPVRPAPDMPATGWVMARAEPRSVFYAGETPFPRVLVPAGLYGDWRGQLSLAAFQNGNLVRSRGRDFGRFRLPSELIETLREDGRIWRIETIGGERFITLYYLHRGFSALEAELGPMTAPQEMVIAVRASALMPFDHLYYLLRLTVAGLLIGLVAYLAGLAVRRKHGMLPAPKIHFRDKVLDTFIAVGIISVFAMGLIGREVIGNESRQAVRTHLEQHLQQVEEVLLNEAWIDEMPHQVVERIRIDSLAFRLGLDLNLYRGGFLVESSRPQLVRQRLIDLRMPQEAYEDLFIRGFRHAFADERIGNFRYTTGYRALTDERGQPRAVIAVPTLPEQERIEEERARTLAYLFGALLLLLLIFIATATTLGSALARPIARLRQGLRSVAEGRFEHLRGTRSRDEISELVETFNEMQDQLMESRKRIARQERDLAWREMARQVAHEIKNPLTPMKLSIQHLKRADQDRRSSKSVEENRDEQKFESMFDRITSTLIEQIDSLARIANEFSIFARLPARHLEKLDLNDVIREAASLLQEEENIVIALHLRADPLPILADREELRRIYINLLKNAHQAMPAGGSVTIHTEEVAEVGQPVERRWAFSTVTDTGTGIPPEVRERIFQPNFSTKTSGMGLGLAIVKKTVEDLDGEIGFETQEGEGTTFWIRLPLHDGKERAEN